MIWRRQPLTDCMRHAPERTALRSGVTTLLSLLALSACGVQTKPPMDVVLHPGDVNYPHLSISPKQIVQFTATVPDGLPHDFHLLYNVESSQDDKDPQLFTSPPGCAWRQQSPFYVDILLTLKRTGNRYTGSFSPDVFEPGPCVWHMTAMMSPNVRSGVVYLSHSLHNNGHPFPDLDLTTQTVHIWCTRKGKDQPRKSLVPSELIDCTPFQMIRIFTELPPGFDASVPAEDKLWNIHITQFLRSLTVEFHDLDALIPAYVETHRSAPQAVR